MYYTKNTVTEIRLNSFVCSYTQCTCILPGMLSALIFFSMYLQGPIAVMLEVEHVTVWLVLPSFQRKTLCSFLQQMVHGILNMQVSVATTLTRDHDHDCVDRPDFRNNPIHRYQFFESVGEKLYSQLAIERVRNRWDLEKITFCPFLRYQYNVILAKKKKTLEILSSLLVATK